ncbi:hypothetical protein FOA52_001200 [Chlamydomonas sp. UWO 241]|nr:hypothetical protein FOA52_001200 [Chlamydomonas sp. UWO 241]
MAKLGEGDQRWIVNELGDAGKNVNNWHWRDYDAMEWSGARLKDLLVGTDLAVSTQGDSSLKISDVLVKGEACVNNRKNKLIPAYELELTLKWEGHAVGSPVTGRILLPYVSDENHDEDPEVKFSSETSDAATDALRDVFLASGRAVVISRVHEFIRELRAGGPMAPGAKGAAEAIKAAEAAATASSSSAEAKPAKAAEVKKEVKANTAASGKTLAITEKYFARASDIYECFVVEGKIRAYTQSGANVDARPGGKFSWYNGSVLGEFVELEADKRIVMRWKFSTWADDCFSTVVITLDTPEHGTTVLKLHQTGIPHEDKFGQGVMDQTETGWRQQVFNRIRQVFGYGA